MGPGSRLPLSPQRARQPPILAPRAFQTANSSIPAQLDGLRVLFCTQDMDSAFQRTRAVLASTLPGVEVRQCHRLEAGAAMQHVDVVVPIAVPITAGMLGASPRLKLVIQFGVGVDAIDIPAATRLGITVANIPSLGTGNALSVAEHAIFLTLASLRHHGAMRRALEAQRLGVPEGLTLWGSTVLVVGYGNIAQELVTRLQPFGCRVLCLRRSAWPEPRTGAAADLEDVGTFPDDIPRLAAQADVVILTCALNPSSVGLVGASFLAACKPGVHIINIARGGLLDRAAVAAGLRDGTIGGMGLDVYWDEPLGSHPSHEGDGIADHPSVYLTPHVGGITSVSYNNMAEILAGEVQRLLQGKLPSHPLNQPVNARLPLACRAHAMAGVE
ncbi:hypothetical protein ACKKBG_A09205 [Auxenochlorella protothecoides x Auxenochlorella symbiontica]